MHVCMSGSKVHVSLSYVELHMWKCFQRKVSKLRAFVNVPAFLMRGSVGSSKPCLSGCNFFY